MGHPVLRVTVRVGEEYNSYRTPLVKSYGEGGIDMGHPVLMV